MGSFMLARMIVTCTHLTRSIIYLKEDKIRRPGASATITLASLPVYTYFLISSPLIGIIHPLHDLEQEPLAPFALVNNRFQQAGRRHITASFAYLVCFPLCLSEMRIVLHQAPDHFPGRNKFAVIVLDGLQLIDVADTADRCAAYTTHTFSQNINGIEDLVGLLIKEPVVVVEM